MAHVEQFAGKIAVHFQEDICKMSAVDQVRYLLSDDVVQIVRYLLGGWKMRRL